MTISIDPTSYLRLPRLDAPSAIALGKMLHESRPRALPPLAERAAQRLADGVKGLEGAWQESLRKGTREADVRRFDKCLDNLWAALRARLVAYKAMPEGQPERARAEALDALIFDGGLEFLKLPYVVEHTESQRRLDLIDAEGVGAELRALVGPLFVDRLVEAHEAYGRALGITAALSAPSPPTRVVEPLREVQTLLRSYTLQLLAHAEEGGEALEAVWAALRPIDTLRAAIERRSARGGGAEGDPGEAPADEPGGESDPGEAPLSA